MPPGFASAIRDELVLLLAPLSAAGSDPDGALRLVGAVGHVGGLGRDPPLRAEIARLAALARDIAALDDQDLASWQGIAEVLLLSRDLMAALRRLEQVVGDPAIAAQAQELGEELAEALLALYLRAHHQRLFRAGAALTLITPVEQAGPVPMVIADGTVERLPWARDRIHPERLRTLLDDPLAVLAAAYLPGGMQKAADAHVAASRLFPLLHDLARALDLHAFRDYVPVRPPVLRPPQPDNPGAENDSEFPAPDESPDPGPGDPTRFLREYRPRFALELPREQGEAPPRFGLAVLASSAEHPEAVRGFLLALAGEASWLETRGDWRVALTSSGTLPAFIVGPGGVKLPPAAVAGATAALTVERIAQAGEPAFALGDPEGLRLEVGALRLRAEVALSPQRSSLAISLDASSAALVLAAGSGDGFLDLVLPGGGARLPFDLGLVLSSDRGLELRGGAGLELALPTRASFGPLTVERIRITLETGDTARLRATGSLGLTLGPVRVTVEGLGMEVAASATGNLGPVDLDAAFRPPTGAGVVVDGGLVTGGGFLFYDEDEEQYAGVVQLELGERLSLTAVGLLTTRLPGGRKGFSLLVIVAVEFDPPIPLVLGLTLGGVGGIVGIHRTMNADALRDGLRNRALDSILFPDDPAADAARVVESLRTVFPPAEGRHLLGVAVRIGWANPPALTAELAIIYEFGDSPRLAIMGQLHVGFPQKSPEKILEMHADGVGIWDVDRDEVTIDARLYDSRVAFVRFSGDIALRSRGGDDSFFLFSAGGYHPEFAVPAGFPALDRLMISLADSEHLRLFLTGYVAITSNTRQIGAEVDFYAGFAGFSIESTLGFDALWEADVRFIVEFDVDFTVKYKGRTLFGVDVNGSFSGPEPKRVQGKWSIDLWLFSVSKTFDKTFGDDRPPVALPRVDPLPQLVAALRDARSWTAAMPARSRSLVTLRSRPGAAEVLVHPFGSLAVRQSVLPLSVRINRFAGAGLGGGERFEITAASIGGQAVPPERMRTLEERFAPAEFLTLTDDQRLDRPSFERMPAGLALQPEGLTFGGQTSQTASHAAVSVIDFDQKIVGAEIPAARRVLSGRAASSSVVFGPAGRSALRSGGMARFRTAGPAVHLRPERFSVTRVDDLTAAAIDGADGGSYTAVRQALDRHVAANPQARGTLQVVPAFQAEEQP